MMMDMMRLQLATARMLTEAQTVIGLRMLGMAGVLPASGGENLRMVTEKQKAFSEAGIAATRAVMRGGTPVAAMEAALKPIGRATSANARRLGKRRPD